MNFLDRRVMRSDDGHRAAQAQATPNGWEVLLTYGGTPGRYLKHLDKDVALHVAQRWAKSGHLPEDPYVPDTAWKRVA